jgi:hypothetical protein
MSIRLGRCARCAKSGVALEGGQTNCSWCRFQMGRPVGYADRSREELLIDSYDPYETTMERYGMSDADFKDAVMPDEGDHG